MYPEHNVLESLRVTENLCYKCVYVLYCFVAVPFGYPSTFTITYKLLWKRPP
jgi:hypothetical protein